MNKKNKVIENSFFYILSALLTKAVAFFLLPVYTLFLTPEDYGIVSLVSAFNWVTMLIIAFSLYSAIIRFYADYKDDLNKVKRFFGTMFIFIFTSSVAFVCLGLIFNHLLVSWFFKNISFYPIVLIGMVTLIFFPSQMLHQFILKGMQQGKKLTIINISFFCLQVFLNLYFIIVLKLGALGIVMTTFLINMGYFIYMIVDLKRNNLITFCIDTNILKEALKYSIPLMPHDLSQQIAEFASRVFINKSTTISLVGLYGVASQIGAIIDGIQSSVNLAFAPWFYHQMNHVNVENKKEIINLSNFLITFYTLIYVGVGLFSQEIIILMTTDKYIRAWTVIPIFVVAYSIKTIYYFYFNILMYYKEATKKIFFSTITGSLTDIILASVMVPLWGMHGGAISFLIAKIIMVGVVVALSKRYNNIGYKIEEMLKIIFPSLVFMGVGLFFSYTKYITIFSWKNLIYKITVLLIYIFYIYFMNKKTIDKYIGSGKIRELFVYTRKNKAMYRKEV